MSTVTSTEARQKWSETLDAAKLAPISISSHGREIAVLMSADLAERALQALEDQLDAAEAEEALASDEPRVSLDEIAAELGINLDE